MLAFASLAAGEAFKPLSFAYVLQAEGVSKSRAKAVSALASCGRDLVVLDIAYDGAEDGLWKAEEIEAIRKGKAGRKVVAYISIGEAEDYRDYWRKEWKAGKGAPSFLLEVNPDWPGNYKVKFWTREWKDMMIPVVERAVRQGFDGAYLDIVDAFEYFEFDKATGKWMDDKVNPETKQSYRRDMVAWVREFASAARRSRPDFIIIPQNGSQLLSVPEFRQTVDAIGVEDLFTDGKRRQGKSHVEFIEGFLKMLQDDGKPVLVIEYPSGAKLKRFVVESCAARGYTPLIAPRELDALGESPR